MSTDRIQKLLFSEYCDFDDFVLLESPFAETSRDGKGIRQVQMGLTPTKLILATDVLKCADDELCHTTCLEAGKIGLDPDIESLELVSVFPIEAVNLSVFRKKKRNTLKAHFCNNIVLYFELGGIEKRRMFWNLWRERVKFLSPNEGGSSLSETSVASSSSLSTLYIADSCLAITEHGQAQLFCNYNAINEPCTLGWKDKDLYLGPDYSINEYSPTESALDSMKSKQNDSSQSPFKASDPPPVRLRSVSSASVLERGPSCMHFINRFGYGVPENTATSYLLKQQNEQQLVEETELDKDIYKGVDMYEIVENGVATWENNRRKHIRRYAFAPQPHFLHGLGPWKVAPGETYSVQIKRAVSMVSIRRQPADYTFRLPISRRQLTTTISCEAVHIMPKYNPAKVSNIKFISPSSPVVFFWTPDYWYRPRSAIAAYTELQSHLHNLKNTNITCKYNVFLGKYRRNEGTAKLKRLLKMEESFNAWNFDSSTIAYQLTMIDRDLFLKIPVVELATLVWQQTSKFAPNVGALIAFSHRISCLVATEILQEKTLQKRARLVARFINVADKCHRLRNYQSTRSVLCGLQSPPIYRLKETWSYVRHHHATKYQRLETLCRRYKDPRLPVYQQMFKQGSLTPPYLPSVAHIVCMLLDRLEEFPENVLVKHSPSSGKTVVPKPLQRIMSAFRIWPSHTDVSKISSFESNQSSLIETKINDFLSTLSTDFDSDTCKTHHLEQVSTSFMTWQKSALLYGLQETKQAKDYLLKARYHEDKENFQFSLILEPLLQVEQ
ncbi:uncharacterized protein LOC142332505 [Lycorma delicatula]|uniref:uncharacterized protein LOC142332505 n=1 Tax=Lycorma delicatula TaxID=130591 RepID=UPI003F51547E